MAIEAADYQGLMTANFIEFLEKIAYFSARRQKCIPERASEKVAMPELFDMISGSETGAMIGSTLVIPNDDPKTSSFQINKYFANTMSDFFYDNTSSIYVDQNMPLWLNAVIVIFMVVLACTTTYCCFNKRYKRTPGYSQKLE